MTTITAKKCEVSTIATTVAPSTKPQIWATSASFQRFDSRRPIELPSSVYPRELGSDRKGMMDQFKPRSVVISTMRVTVTTASQIMAHYVTDQLESEVKREERVVRGEITPDEADRLNEEWEKKEWASRWSAYPTKALHALGRFHAVTLLMRVTEWYLSRRVTEEVLDRLTRDTFKAAIRENERGLEGKDLRKEMWQVCLWANMIAFGCECAVSQCLLMWGYMGYSRRRNERMKRNRERLRLKKCEVKGVDDKTGELDEDENDDAAYAGPMGLSLALRSSKLITSRFLGLLAASAGGAIGSQMYPGWGTLLGGSCGDGMAAALLES